MPRSKWRIVVDVLCLAFVAVVLVYGYHLGYERGKDVPKYVDCRVLDG